MQSRGIKDPRVKNRTEPCGLQTKCLLLTITPTLRSCAPASWLSTLERYQARRPKFGTHFGLQCPCHAGSRQRLIRKEHKCTLLQGTSQCASGCLPPAPLLPPCYCSGPWQFSHTAWLQQHSTQDWPHVSGAVIAAWKNRYTGGRRKGGRRDPAAAATPVGRAFPSHHSLTAQGGTSQSQPSEVFLLEKGTTGP